MSILILHKKNLSRRRHLARAREYARAHGERLLLVMKDPTWEAEYVDRVAVADTTSIAETLAVAKELAGDEAEPIRAVVTFAEASVPAVARLAAEFGLPACGERTAYIARDKYAMRTALEGVDGIAQPRYGLARSLDEAREQADRIGYPLVLKPIIGTGSMYVRSIDDAAELAEHFETIRRGSWDGFGYDPLHGDAFAEYGGAVLMEQFVPGAEISVESLVVDGETHSIAIHDKPLPTGPTFEEVYACTPTRLPADTVATIYTATRAVHRSMNITTGPTHVEFRLRDGVEPVLLEAAARLGGGPIYRSVQLSTGVDMVEAMLDLATGRTPTIAPRPEPTPVGFRNVFPDGPGELVAIHGVDEARASGTVDELEIYRAVGDFLDVPPRTFQGHGHVIFTAETPDRLDGAFDHLVRTLRLETRPVESGQPQAQP
jgi:biotin carboxylase